MIILIMSFLIAPVLADEETSEDTFTLRAGCRGLWAELRLRGGRPQGSLLCAVARSTEWVSALSLHDEQLT
jgi:hypothetical protein